MAPELIQAWYGLVYSPRSIQDVMQWRRHGWDTKYMKTKTSERKYRRRLELYKFQLNSGFVEQEKHNRCKDASQKILVPKKLGVWLKRHLEICNASSGCKMGKGRKYLVDCNCLISAIVKSCPLQHRHHSNISPDSIAPQLHNCTTITNKLLHVLDANWAWLWDSWETN